MKQSQQNYLLELVLVINGPTRIIIIRAKTISVSVVLKAEGMLKGHVLPGQMLPGQMLPG